MENSQEQRRNFDKFCLHYFWTILCLFTPENCLKLNILCINNLKPLISTKEGFLQLSTPLIFRILTNWHSIQIYNYRYVEQNTWLSNKYKRYDLESILWSYLHNRQGHIVQHCLEKKIWQNPSPLTIWSLKVKVSLKFTAKQLHVCKMCGTKFPLVDMMQHHHVRFKSGNIPVFHAKTCLQNSDINLTGVFKI